VAVLDSGQRPWRMRDVAQMAGVSHQTVSRVLNNPDLVSSATTKKVLDVIQKLDYRPSPAARALTTRRSGVIGVIDSGSKVLGQTQLLSSVERAARAAGFATLVAVVEDQRVRGVREAFDQLTNHNVEGIVAMGNTIEISDAAERLSASVPVAIVHAAQDQEGSVIHVGVDSVAAGAKATAHLIDVGRTKIAHVSGKSNWVDAMGRMAGWRQALDEADLGPGLVLPGDWTPTSGYQAGKAIAKHGGIDGVFVANDEMALGLLWALTESGARVPDDIAVIGFDDMPGTEFYNPPLSTMAQPFAELGRNCIEQLLTMIGGGEAHDVLFPAELIVRKSTVGE